MAGRGGRAGMGLAMGSVRGQPGTQAIREVRSSGPGQEIRRYGIR